MTRQRRVTRIGDVLIEREERAPTDDERLLLRVTRVFAVTRLLLNEDGTVRDTIRSTEYERG